MTRKDVHHQPVEVVHGAVDNLFGREGDPVLHDNLQSESPKININKFKAL